MGLASIVVFQRNYNIKWFFIVKKTKWLSSFSPTNSVFTCQTIFTVLGNQKYSNISSGKKNKLHLILNLYCRKHQDTLVRTNLLERLFSDWTFVPNHNQITHSLGNASLLQWYFWGLLFFCVFAKAPHVIGHFWQGNLLSPETGSKHSRLREALEDTILVCFWKNSPPLLKQGNCFRLSAAPLRFRAVPGERSPLLRLETQPRCGCRLAFPWNWF